MNKFLPKPLVLSIALFAFLGCSKDDDNDDDNTPALPTIAATVGDDARFTILLDALTRTGLTSTLDDARFNLTVFAPNDAAFQELLQDLNLADLDALENALTTAGLRNVLLYHVMGSEVKAASLTTGYASTLATDGNSNNLSLYIDVTGLEINGEADVEATDIDASNGVIHEIDEVIVPLTIYELIELSPDFTSLDAALSAADGDLDDLVDSAGVSLTLFAPDNNAFDGVIQGTPMVNNLTELVAALGTDVLADILLYHVLDGNLRAENITPGAVTTAEGSDFTIVVDSQGEVSIVDGQNNMSTVTDINIQGTNGVVHRISEVLLLP